MRSAPKEANRCVVASSHREPLVTEWSASSKSRLEVLLTKTLANTDRYAVAVEYSGCELRIVDTCRPKAAYDWSKSTLSRDTVEINDADDLYAKLPLGAVNLEGALRRSGRLSIQTTVAGQILLDRTSIDFNLVASDPGCAEATHVIQAVSIGAFKMVEGGQGQASAGAGVTGIAHGGASTSRTEQVMRTAGSDADCEQTTEGKPHHGCRSPLQLFLVPIPHKTEKVVLRPTAPELITPVVVAPVAKAAVVDTPPAKAPAKVAEAPVAKAAVVETPPEKPAVVAPPAEKPVIAPPVNPPVVEAPKAKPFVGEIPPMAANPTTREAPAVAKPKKNSTLRTLSYLVGGLGVAGLGGGAASFGIAGGVSSKIYRGGYETPNDISSAYDTMSTTRTLGAGGLISGGLLLGIAIPLFILGGK